MVVVIYLMFLLCPFIGFLLSGKYSALSATAKIVVSIGLPVTLLLTQLNNHFEKYYVGTNAHIPVLWLLIYALIWVWIISIKNKRGKITICCLGGISHVAVILFAAIPGIWVIGDLLAPSEVIYTDKNIKAYQTGWGNFAHSGIELHVVKRGFGIQRVIYYKNISGINPKDNAVSIHSDDQFVYKVTQGKQELKTLLVP